MIGQLEIRWSPYGRRSVSPRKFWPRLLLFWMAFLFWGCTSTPIRDQIIDIQGGIGEVVRSFEGARDPITLDGDEIGMEKFSVPLPLAVDLGIPGTILHFHNGTLKRLGRIPLDVDGIDALHYTTRWHVSPEQLALVLGPSATVDSDFDMPALIDITVDISRMSWHAVQAIHAQILEMSGANAPDSGEVLFISETISAPRIQFRFGETMRQRIALRGTDILAAHLIDSLHWDDADNAVLVREFHEPVLLLYKTLCLETAKGCPFSEKAGLLAPR